MGRNGTSASLLVEDLRAAFERVSTEQGRLTEDYARQMSRLMERFYAEVMGIAVGYFRSAGTLEEFECALVELTTPESKHFEDMGWFAERVEELLPPGSDVGPFLMEALDSRGRSILARLRTEVVDGGRRF